MYGQLVLWLRIGRNQYGPVLTPGVGIPSCGSCVESETPLANCRVNWLVRSSAKRVCAIVHASSASSRARMPIRMANFTDLSEGPVSSLATLGHLTAIAPSRAAAFAPVSGDSG